MNVQVYWKTGIQHEHESLDDSADPTHHIELPQPEAKECAAIRKMITEYEHDSSEERAESYALTSSRNGQSSTTQSS